MRKIVLASSSPRREKLLRLTGLDFIVDPSDLHENLNQKLSPPRLAMELAYQKATDVYARHPISLVLGADTTVVLNNEVMGKPRNPQHAIEMLRKLSGQKHRVITGLCLANQKKVLRDYCITEVEFFPIRERDIKAYVETGEHLDKAGAYAIQDQACWFVKEVRGDYQNVMGLPLTLLKKMLRNFDN